MTIKKKTIIITGASSGLGYAMAVEYASPNTRLFLLARSEERLKYVESLCQQKGADTTAIIADVRDKELMYSYLEMVATQFKIDIIVACAGVSAGTLNGLETIHQVNEIFDTNLNGTLNTILPVLPHMIQQKSGNIVVISSMAGLLGLSSAPSYSASKGAVKLFGEGLRAYLMKYNVKVSIVIPGYIKTPMTDVNNFPMPFMISAKKAACKIIANVNKGRGIIAFPLITYYLLKLLNLLPSSLVCYINSKIPGKPAFDLKK